MAVSIIRGDASYRSEMESTVLPYLEKRRKSGTFEAVPGEKIYFERYRADQPKGTVIMLHGFTESIVKFRETSWYFLQNGYHVWLMEQRGHGRSFRSVEDPSLVHIKDYRSLLRDLHCFVTRIVKPRVSPGEPLYFYGHSMGGGVGACYLQRYPDDFSKAILSSPMLEIDAGGIPVWIMRLFADFMILTGRGDRYLPGALPYQSKPDFENSCSNCLARYTWYHDYTNAQPLFQTCAPSIQTALQFLKITREAVTPKNCRRVKTDVLLLQAGRDNTVKPGGQEDFIQRIGQHGKLVRFENARHEIYMGQDTDLAAYYREIFLFLG